jgi:polysaccharide deacetylase 2 family uncharacterized protein YibQ
MAMRLPNNFINGDIIRRFSIGLCLGLPIVIILSFLGNSEDLKISSNNLDNEIVSIVKENAPSPPDNIDIEQTQENNVIDIAPGLFELFESNRNSLSTVENAAIENDSPRLSIIVKNVGKNRTFNQLIQDKLPASVALSLSPYINNFNDVAVNLHQYGYELWMDISALTLDMNSDQGTMALSPTFGLERNLNLLSGQTEGRKNITGLLLPQGALLTETPTLWADIAQDIFASGYGILDNTVGIIKPSLYFFDDNRAPYIKGDVYIQAKQLSDLKMRLSNLREDIMRDKNLIVTLTLSTPAHLDILAQWIESLEQNGITLVPLSAQAKL